MGELLNKQEQQYYFCGQLRQVSFSLGYRPQCIIIICLHNMSETCQCLITVRSEQAKTRYWLHILKGKLRAAGVFFFRFIVII